MKGTLSLALALAACGSAPASQVETRPVGSAVGSAAPASCDSVRGRVETLYRADAQVREPTRVDEATADNTAMVMTDCRRTPDATVACIARVATVADLERQCLAPLDQEGTEGEASR